MPNLLVSCPKHWLFGHNNSAPSVPTSKDKHEVSRLHLQSQASSLEASDTRRGETPACEWTGTFRLRTDKRTVFFCFSNLIFDINLVGYQLWLDRLSFSSSFYSSFKGVVQSLNNLAQIFPSITANSTPPFLLDPRQCRDAPHFPAGCPLWALHLSVLCSGNDGRGRNF